MEELAIVSESERDMTVHRVLECVAFVVQLKNGHVSQCFYGLNEEFVWCYACLFGLFELVYEVFGNGVVPRINCLGCCVDGVGCQVDVV